MRKLMTLLGVAAFVATSLSVSAYAQDNADSDATLCSYCWEKGEFYNDSPEASRVLLFPVRVTAAAVGAPVGAVSGMAKRSGEAVQWVNDRTFRAVVAEGEDPTERMGGNFVKGVFLVPMGVVGTAAALPLGATYGAVEGTFKGFAKGYFYPDSW